MLKLIVAPVLLALFLYLLIHSIKRFKPYKFLVVPLSLLAVSALILTTIVYIF